jgi:hypothetical protein
VLLQDNAASPHGTKRSRNDVDTSHRLAPTPNSTLSDGVARASIGPQGSADGMGVIVFGDEEDRAYFGMCSTAS